MTERILVTGSRGLVGMAMQGLYKDDPRFFFADRSHADLCSREAAQKLFERVKPTCVIHIAALVGGIGAQLERPATFFRENMIMSMNVFEASRHSGVKKIVGFLSSCIFPDKAVYPLTPEQLHLGPPHPSNFGYAYAKRMLEVLGRAYQSEFGLRSVFLVPPNIYGPHDNFSLMDGHVLPSLIHRAYLAKKNNEALTVWGSGKPFREFIFSEDVARVAVWAAESYESAEPLNVSSSVETSIREAVETIGKAFNFTGPIRFDDSKPDGQLRKPTDTTSLRKALPGFKFTSLAEGIRRTASWFEANYPEVKI